MEVIASDPENFKLEEGPGVNTRGSIVFLRLIGFFPQ